MEPESNQDDLDALLNLYSAAAEAENNKLLAKNAAKNRPKGQAAQREAGLKTRLPENNVGHRLLTQMGWTEGKAIGRGNGRAEPLELVLKTTRAGLGVDEQRRRAREAQQMQEEQERAKRSRQVEESQQRYHAATRASHAARQATRHLRGAWRVAEQLAEQLDATPAARPSPQQEQLGQEQEARAGGGGSSGLEEGGGRGWRGRAMEALSLLLQQLPTLQEIMQQEAQAQAGRGAERRVSAEPREGPDPVGCCGQQAAASSQQPVSVAATRQASPDDQASPAAAAEAAALSATPQQDAQQHQLQPQPQPHEEEEAEPPSLAAQLELLLLHLRQSHCYCYFCGTAYDGPDDMAAHCPGLTEDEH